MVTIKFTNPPLIEVLLGIQLEDLELSSIHFGLYWQTIRDRYPLQVDRPVIPLEDEESEFPLLPRVLFISSDNKKLIQLQNNFFSCNWRHSNEYKYPHFEEIFTGFMEEWTHFQKWYKEQKIIEEPLKPFRYELTYLNVLDKDVGWNSPADNQQIFTFVNSSPGFFLGTPYAHDVVLNYSLPNNDGTLIVQLDQRFSEEEEDSDFLFFRLTIGSSDSSKDLTLWFQAAHDYMVKSFLDLTQKNAQKKWGRLDE